MSLQGAPGQDGANGQGIAPGGSTGQVLAKYSLADYATHWINPPSCGSSFGEGVITIPGVVFGEYSVNIVDAEVLSTNLIIAKLVPTDEHDAGDLLGKEVYAVARNGSIDFTLVADDHLVGNYTIVYIKGAIV